MEPTSREENLMAAKEKTIKVGKTVEAFCPICKANTTHKVTAAQGGKIKKVKCTKCASTTAFRAPKKMKPPAIGANGAKPRLSTRRLPKDWATLVAAVDQKTAPTYKLSGDYSNVTALSHKIFGLGVITRVLSPDKIEVVFKKKTAILAQNLK
jgi:hypothetical protein